MRALSLAALLLAACSAENPLVDPDLPALQSLSNSVDRDALMTTVTDLTNAHLGDAKIDCATFPDVSPRFCALSHDASRELLRSRLEALGYTVTEHPAGEGVFATRNVIAERIGNAHPEEVILIGAHYDAFFGGADDNSTGIAAVLELARLFAGLQLDRTVRFIGFDFEEVGLTGSTRYVESLGPSDQIVASIVFDCIGVSRSEPGSQLSLPGLPSPDKGDFIAVIANARSDARLHEVRALNDAVGAARMVGIAAPGDGASPIAGNLMRSDHAPFWISGRAALFFTDTANFRNAANYHRDSDLPGTLDPEFLASTVRLAAVSAAYMAGGPR